MNFLSRPLIIVSVIVIIAFSVVGCMDYPSSPLPDTLFINASGVEFSPNCFTDNGEIRGIDVDIA